MSDSSSDKREQLQIATTTKPGRSEDDESTDFDVMDIVRVRAEGGTADVYEKLEAAKVQGLEAAAAAAAENGDPSSSGSNRSQDIIREEAKDNQGNDLSLVAIYSQESSARQGPAQTKQEEEDGEGALESGLEHVPASRLAALRYTKDEEEGPPTETTQDDIPALQQPIQNQSTHPLAPRPGAYSGAPGTDLERLDSMRFSLVGVLGNRATDERKSSRTEISPASPDASHPITDTGNGLSRATPVQEQSITDANLQQVDIESLERKKASQTKQRTIFFLASISLLVMAMVVCVGIVFGLRKNDSRSSDIPPSISPSTSPTVAPTGPLDTLLAVLPQYTLASLDDPFSAQTQAYSWLSTHRNVSSLEEWRKVQLLALATIYYSWDGPNWPNGLNKDWLDDTKSECYWFSSSTSTWGQLTGAFHGNQGNSSCNIAGEIKVLNLQESFDLSEKKVSFPPEIALLTNLVEIDLTGVGLNASLSGEVWPVVSSLAKLENLRLLSNSLTGTIPRELSTLSNLVRLSLGFNVNLSGFIPTELGLLSRMKSLELSFSSLSGPLPSQLSQLTNLEELDFSISMVSGQIPSEIFLLPSLQLMLLYGSFLSGPVPSEFGLLTNLSMLMVSSNAFSESLPSQFGLMTSLQYLDVVSNSFSGTIPGEISLLKDLTHLKISENTISGIIPTQIGLMGFMEVLEMGGNALSGQIPTQLGTLSILQALYLGENLLSGPIPSQVGLLKSVEWMHLHDNMLSGQIPKELGLLSALQRLHLGHNMLTGNIPGIWASLDFNSSAKPDFSLSEQEQNYWEPDFLYDFGLSNNPLLTGTIPNDLCLMNTKACTHYALNYFTDSWETKACAFEFDCTDLLCGCGDVCPCLEDPARAPTI